MKNNKTSDDSQRHIRKTYLSIFVHQHELHGSGDPIHRRRQVNAKGKTCRSLGDSLFSRRHALFRNGQGKEATTTLQPLFSLKALRDADGRRVPGPLRRRVVAR